MNQRPTPLPIAPLRLTLRSAGLAFPGFAGSLWHGGLGRMLERHFPASFRLLYGGQGDTRLYALCPPAGERFPPGDLLTLRLSLFGEATGHLLACTQAIALLGEAGIDPAGRFQLESASVLLPDGEAPYFSAADGLLQPPPLTDFADWLPAGQAPRQIAVRLLTPLHLKEGGELLRHAPDYGQLLHRLFGRLDQLAHVIGCPPPLAKSDRAALLDEARQVTRLAEDIRWQQLDRRSARTRQQMRFGGLQGELRFTGEMTQTLPWLVAGQQVHIGGKTAFGFGAYEVEARQ
ncbi:CRISPR system precrRNA processing endoribonuclease RAMP protein Cas6 [Accumulibacter sp.]|uniref:CRISPR system precrRNA processing endoribonuclease RAMP protein Cas6 n=1 Tax=Accumulibacter sp. TaxID=2053492 RepID=UPI0025F760E8|nr:CRISPR system precrRNA processing endoribonuclease RAMP protein Cas6 [Accumulibacter sp.]MCM8611299.1 CRISPR system precrRNA processing endoribonuclease RAMP protein Cas6 [Accumulibacter sp.]MCM8635054.1 CRISPR system precrRNA processing endoribonuclease RAMP protein Cas6 [Accumulibacter sp.]MCM8639842.1 CRISPR system precrRNA processing endoribonuclease RAMP protein Cas6 [Accumulibacter sp.]